MLFLLALFFASGVRRGGTGFLKYHSYSTQNRSLQHSQFRYTLYSNCIILENCGNSLRDARATTDLQPSFLKAIERGKLFFSNPLFGFLPFTWTCSREQRKCAEWFWRPDTELLSCTLFVQKVFLVET